MRVRDEVREMNENKISNIIDRGGVEGWQQADNLSSLTRTFEFKSFREANHFI